MPSREVLEVDGRGFAVESKWRAWEQREHVDGLSGSVHLSVAGLAPTLVSLMHVGEPRVSMFLEMGKELEDVEANVDTDICLHVAGGVGGGYTGRDEFVGFAVAVAVEEMESQVVEPDWVMVRNNQIDDVVGVAVGCGVRGETWSYNFVPCFDQDFDFVDFRVRASLMALYQRYQLK
jgi:hypothetical protein